MRYDRAIKKHGEDNIEPYCDKCKDTLAQVRAFNMLTWTCKNCENSGVYGNMQVEWREVIKDKSKIPGGIYCYNNNGTCPYYNYVRTDRLYENNGEKCPHRDKCDEECGTDSTNSCTVKVVECKYMRYVDECEDSLLWDMVKECGINGEIDEESK